MNADDYIRELGLAPHPEGGFFRQTYAATDHWPAEGLPARYDGARAASTAIYFLLRDDQVSHLHRLASDEVWHFYIGDPLIVHMIAEDGAYRAQYLGPDLAQGQLPQFVVPAGCWFGAEVAGGRGFALVGNTVAPGFDFADFELAEAESLASAFPDQASLIRRLSAR